MINWEVLPDANDQSSAASSSTKRTRPMTYSDFQTFKATAELEGTKVRRTPAKHMYIILPTEGALEKKPQLITSYTDVDGAERWGANGQKVEYDAETGAAMYMKSSSMAPTWRIAQWNGEEHRMSNEQVDELREYRVDSLRA